MNIKYFKNVLLPTLITSSLLLGSVATQANPRYHNKNPHHSYQPYRIGSHHRVLPHGYKTIRVGSYKYYSHNNVYYKPINNGYVVVEEPTIITTTTNSPMYIYPALGQTSEQQRQDRYECHVWASEQTGFDPSNVTANTTTKHVYADQAQVEPGQNGMVTGAIGGAAVGALGGAIAGEPGTGAAVGAGLGAITGAVTQNHRQRPVTQTVVVDAAPGNGKANYDRAITACLEARHYTVK
jgi:YMGG-like Gly-zipper